MPAKPKYELIPCEYFPWRLFRRGQVWCVDGRTSKNKIKSLGTTDKAEALRNLKRLDEKMAFERGLIDQRPEYKQGRMLTLADGRRFYEEHTSRPRLVGGVKERTQTRNAVALNKFIEWAKSQGIESFNVIDTKTMNRYAAFLDTKNAPKTIKNELVTIKSCINYLTKEDLLIGAPTIKLTLGKVESQKAYCYRATEVNAIIALCRASSSLQWLGDVIVVLACTGMRISELINLKWSDLNFEKGWIQLVDESGKASKGKKARTLKSGVSRSFPIHPDLRGVLEKLPHPDPYVFHDNQGRKLKDSFVRNSLIRKVLKPLASKFPPKDDGLSFIDGRLHSFRHYFISACASSRVAERVVMEWVGHAHSSMVRHYFQLHDEEARSHMDNLNLLGAKVGRSNGPQQVLPSSGDNKESA
jgi:integrase